MGRVLMALAAALALAACAQQAPPSAEELPDPSAISVARELEMLADDGRAIAEAQCAACHSVGEYGDSPNVDAPPLRYALANHGETVLAEELINGIQVTHQMPGFQFNPQGVDALIVYLQSIQQPPPN